LCSPPQESQISETVPVRVGQISPVDVWVSQKSAIFALSQQVQFFEIKLYTYLGASISFFKISLSEE
jgi:hypothetical protein